jgi:EcoEI R protein C-terminal
VDARNIRNIALMRPINSMIEFNQIIGHGSRLYDGKDYFTVYDFVKAHHHFSDPEWDGEPIEPEPSQAAPVPPPKGLAEPPGSGFEPGARPQRIKIELADGKACTIQHMQAFLAFVLSHYVRVGVEELDREKLRPLLLLRYNNAIADAVADLGRPEEIGHVFTGFQKYLYQAFRTTPVGAGTSPG